MILKPSFVGMMDTREYRKIAHRMQRQSVAVRIENNCMVMYVAGEQTSEIDEYTLELASTAFLYDKFILVEDGGCFEYDSMVIACCSMSKNTNVQILYNYNFAQFAENYIEFSKMTPREQMCINDERIYRHWDCVCGSLNMLERVEFVANRKFLDRELAERTVSLVQKAKWEVLVGSVLLPTLQNDKEEIYNFINGLWPTDVWSDKCAVFPMVDLGKAENININYDTENCGELSYCVSYADYIIGKLMRMGVKKFVFEDIDRTYEFDFSWVPEEWYSELGVGAVNDSESGAADEYI